MIMIPVYLREKKVQVVSFLSNLTINSNLVKLSSQVEPFTTCYLLGQMQEDEKDDEEFE